MLDIRLIREDADSIKERVKKRGGDAWELVDKILECDVVRRAAVALGHTGGDRAKLALRAYLTAERGNNPLPAWRKAGHRGDAARAAHGAAHRRTGRSRRGRGQEPCGRAS